MIDFTGIENSDAKGLVLIGIDFTLSTQMNFRCRYSIITLFFDP